MSRGGPLPPPLRDAALVVAVGLQVAVVPPEGEGPEEQEERQKQVRDAKISSVFPTLFFSKRDQRSSRK